jgi:hypothetical protein
MNNIPMQINIPEEFKQYITLEANPFDGYQIRLTFPNGYGASIINHTGSYGLEMAVLYDDALCYSTPITDDVIGNMTDEELKDNLTAVMNLEAI